MPIIDCHCDTIDKMYHEGSHLAHNNCHIDLEKLKQASYVAQWFAIFIDSQVATEDKLMDKFKKMHQYFIKELNENKDDIVLATDYTSYRKNKQLGKISAFLSTEEGQIIDGEKSNIDVLYELGVRMMTLTWNYSNVLAAPHHKPEGLTHLGREIVAHLENKKMLLDVSHLSDSGVKDILKIYHKPIIASHSNARAIKNHTRNLPDKLIREIAQRGGIIGINFYNEFLGDSASSKVQEMLHHIEHIYQIGGSQVLALGTDFDGISCELEVCNAGKMGIFIDRLTKVYSEELIEKLCFKNVERLIKENL